MTSLDYSRQWIQFSSGAEKAFSAAFFFLSLSKPLLFISLAVACLLFAGTGGLVHAGRSWRVFRWTIPALILAFLPLLSLLVRDDFATGLSQLGLAYYWVLAFLVFFAASGYQVELWLRAFVAGVFAMFCYMEAIKYGWIAFSWVPAGAANYILYSQFLAMAIVVLSVLYRHDRSKRLKALYLVMIAALYFGVLTGMGRSGMLAIAVLLPFIVFNIFPGAKAGKILLGCLIAGFILVASPVVQMRSQRAINDLQLMQNEVRETSLGYRFDMWRTAVDNMRKNPLLGAGTEGFRSTWNSMPGKGATIQFVEPHNAFLFYGSSYGILGLVALVWLYATLLYTGWTHRAVLEGGVVFGFAVICVLGSFTNTMFMGAVSHAWLMMFIGLQGGLLRIAPVPAAANLDQAPAR